MSGIIDVVTRVPRGPGGVDRLRTESERVGIGLSLAHAVGAVGFARDGNRRLLEAVAGTTDVLPIAAIAPEAGDAAVSVAELAAGGAVGFWLGTDTWSGSPERPSAATDELLRAVSRTGRPLLVPIRSWGDATIIGERTAGLGLAVVLVGARYDTIADDIAAAQIHPHLHLETSRLAHLTAVERVVSAIGHERLLLGTGSPGRALSAPLNAVASAAIENGQKQAVLGGNAARLFGLPRGVVEVPAVLDAGGAVDVHTHLPPSPWDVPDVSIGELTDLLAGAGITRAAASSTVAILGEVAAGNEATARACAADDRLLGYLVVDPGDIDTSRDQLRRWRGAPGIVGAKLHCQWAGHATSSAAVASVVALLDDAHLPLKVHVDGDDWADALLVLARRHPHLPIIVAHAGPGAAHVDLAPVIAATDNVYMELASSFADLEAVRALAAAAPSGRLLFGTDAPLLEPAFALGTYADAGLTPASRPDVFRDTAAALFGLTT